MTGDVASNRRIAWTGALLAATLSVAVNVGHAWPQGIGFVAFSAAMPLLLLVTSEQMARRLLGRWTIPVLLLVGICAYSLSFWHAYLLLESWREPWPLRILGAIGPDVLAVGSVVALYQVGRARVDFIPADIPAPGTSPAVEVPPPVAEPELPANYESRSEIHTPVARPQRRPRAKGRAPASDEQLLARLDELVEAGELAPDAVTGNRVRITLKTGAERSTRLAVAWQERRRPLHAVGREAS